MKKLGTLLILAVLVLINYQAGAQVIDKFGDNTGSLDGIMKAYYDVVTVEKGQKPSYERDSLLHYGNVQVGWAVKAKSGKMAFKYVSLKEYHRLSDDYSASTGFY